MGILRNLFTSQKSPEDTLDELHDAYRNISQSRSFSLSFQDYAEFANCHAVQPLGDWVSFQQAIASGRLQIKATPGSLKKGAQNHEISIDNFKMLLRTDEITFCYSFWWNSIYLKDPENDDFFVSRSFLDDPKFRGCEDEEIQRIRTHDFMCYSV